MNNLEKLKLPKMKENINKYLDMMSDGVKTPLEAIDEMAQLEMKYREDLATLRFIENCENIIICGTPGVGKTHLAVGIGTEAAKQRYSVYCISFHDLIAQLRKAKYENRLERRIKWICRYKLLIVDELGYEKMDADTANLFFNLIAKRYEKSSTIITTNLTFSKWAEVFGDPVLTNALLDRLLHHSSVLNINGPSYRLKDQLQFIVDED